MATHGTLVMPTVTHNTAAPAEGMTRWLLAGGLIGSLLFVVDFLVEGATRPGYSAWRNFVSQLSLNDQGWEQVANFIIFGTLCVGASFWRVASRVTQAGGDGRSIRRSQAGWCSSLPAM